MKENEISYNRNNFQSEPNFLILDKEDNSQILKLAVTYSYFMIEMTVLNCLEESITKVFRLLGKGGYSNVHQFKMGTHTNEFIAIKSVRYSE